MERSVGLREVGCGARHGFRIRPLRVQGADLYFVKPFSVRDLVATVTELGAR